MSAGASASLALRPRWAALCARIPGRAAPPAPVQVDATLATLAALYANPPRAYHHLGHVADCLREFDLLCAHAGAPWAIEFALWWHDAVYDPHAHDNEARSAAVAVAALRDLGAAVDLPAVVTTLILATRHTEPPATLDEQIIVDVDLAILGQPAEVFDAYERAIRQEYAFVEDAAFAAGRAAILRRFLARPRIYHTALFHERYEATARANLQRSLARLE